MKKEEFPRVELDKQPDLHYLFGYQSSGWPAILTRNPPTGRTQSVLTLMNDILGVLSGSFSVTIKRVLPECESARIADKKGLCVLFGSFRVTT